MKWRSLVYLFRSPVSDVWNRGTPPSPQQWRRGVLNLSVKLCILFIFSSCYISELFGLAQEYTHCASTYSRRGGDGGVCGCGCGIRGSGLWWTVTGVLRWMWIGRLPAAYEPRRRCPQHRPNLACIAVQGWRGRDPGRTCGCPHPHPRGPCRPRGLTEAVSSRRRETLICACACVAALCVCMCALGILMICQKQKVGHAVFQQ